MAIWDIVAGPIISIINKLIPDKAAAALATTQLQQLAMQGQLTDELAQLQAITVNQSDINKVEAANPSLFVAGPRPAVMWICAGALGYQYCIRPLWMGFALVSGHPVPSPGLPGIDDNLYQLLWALLGLGAMRSFDKLKGIDTRVIGK